MVNPHRGEVALDGPDGPLTLRLSFNAVCEVEAELGMSIYEVTEALDQKRGPPWTTVRALFRAALREHHPEIDLKAAGEIIGAIGLIDTARALGEALTLAFPPAREGPGAKKKTAAKP